VTVEDNPLSFREARTLARLVRRAELGREAVATVRPRRVVGLVRSRAPLPVVLYVADREGRLVRRGQEELALLEPPLVPSWRPAAGPWLRLLRLVDRRWDQLWMFGPPALALLAAAAVLPFRPLWIIAGLLAAVALCYIFVFMAGQLVWPAIGWLRRLGRGPRRTDEVAVESLPGYHWSIRLCHITDVAHTQALLRLVRDRLVLLVETRVRVEARRLGVRVERAELVETMVCLTRGITSEAARDAVRTAVGTLQPHQSGDDVLILLSSGRLDAVPRRPSVGGGFFFLYAFGLAAMIAMLAILVASFERAACVPESCVGRPDSYAEAVHYLAQRLLLFDNAGLSAATAQATILGWLISIAGLTAIPVAYVSAHHQIELTKAQRQEFEETMATVVTRSRVLVLVVAPKERDAVITSITARSKQPPTPTFVGDCTPYALGRVSGADVLLVQAGEQGPGTPAGMVLTAATAMDQLQPDYVILTGTCYGLRPERQRLGDVIFCRQVQDLDHVLVHDEDGRLVTRDRGVIVQPSPTLISCCNAVEVTRPKDGPAVHSGRVLSSSALVDSPTLAAELRDRYPDAIGGEMESAAVYAAASLRGIDWIVVKAISDWGGGRTAAHSDLAAHNAAEFVAHMLEIGALDRRRSR